MKPLLVLFLSAVVPASAGYDEALRAAPGAVRESMPPMSGAELARDPEVSRLLKENAGALELFRQAAAAPCDGCLRGAVTGDAGGAPSSSLAAHLSLFRLLLVDAKIALYAERPGDAERDLLAAAGFISHAASRKGLALAGSLAAQRALAEACPVFLASLRGGAAAPAYMADLARRLDEAAAAQDHMRAAMREEGEALKAAFKELLSAEKRQAYLAGMPLGKRLLAKRLLDEEAVLAAVGIVSAEADAGAKALEEGFAANDAELAASLLESRRRDFAALGRKYPPPGRLGAFKDWLFPGRAAKEAAAFQAAEKFLSSERPDRSGLIPAYHAFYNALNVLRAGLAVKRFQRARRRLPESLEQLVPDYLPAVPRDTFASSSPLAYVKGKKVFSVYSVGPDRADGGGRDALDLEAFLAGRAAKAGDIVFLGN